MDSNVIRKNMIWNVVGSMGFVGAQWMMTILIVRLSGYEDAGWLSLGLSLTNISTNIVYFGIRNYQVSDTAGKYSDADYIAQRIIMAILALIIYSVFILINGYEIKKSLFLILFMIYRMSEPIADVFHGIDQKSWRLDIAGQSFLMRGMLGLTAFVIMQKFLGDLIITTVVMILLVYPIIIFFDIPKALSIGKVKFTPGKFGRQILCLTFECFPLFLYAICLNSVVPVPRYYLEKAAGSEILGYYASAAIPASIIQMLSSYIYTTFTGLFSTYKEDGNKDAFKSLAFKLGLSIILLGGCACLFCVIPAGFLPGADGIGLGDWALCLLFTGTIAPYTYLLVPTIGSCILIALVWYFGMLLTVLRDRKGLTIGAVSGVVSVIPAAYCLVGRYLEDGVNPSIAVSSTVTFIIFLIRLIKGINNIGK